MMKLQYFVALSLGLAASVVAAHTQLSSSVPAEQAVVAAAPEEVVLTFSTDVRITALSLKDAADVSYELDALPTAAQREFAIAVPTLTAGDYTVAWRAVGADTHVVSGEIHFSIAAS